MLVQNQVGPIATTTSLGAGIQSPGRAGNMGDAIVSELHGRFYEQNYRGGVYGCGSLAGTALASTHATATGLTATATPVIGIYNPSGSGYNAVILQASILTWINNVTSVAPGAFVWVVATGQGAISTGVTPFNRKTLTASGSVCKGFAGATALTGMVGSVAIFDSIPQFPIASGLLTTTVAAATPTPGVTGVANLDGAFIVPPGGVLAVMNTLAVTTHSFVSSMTWEEVPI